MANFDKISTKSLSNFGNLCNKLLENVTSKIASRIDFVFDSYMFGSIKDCERLCRNESTQIEQHIIKSKTPLPVDMSTFWPSIENKSKLQHLLAQTVLESSDEYKNVDLFVSGMCGDNPLPCQSVRNGVIYVHPHLDS